MPFVISLSLFSFWLCNSPSLARFFVAEFGTPRDPRVRRSCQLLRNLRVHREENAVRPFNTLISQLRVKFRMYIYCMLESYSPESVPLFFLFVEEVTVNVTQLSVDLWTFYAITVRRVRFCRERLLSLSMPRMPATWFLNFIYLSRFCWRFHFIDTRIHPPYPEQRILLFFLSKNGNFCFLLKADDGVRCGVL